MRMLALNCGSSSIKSALLELTQKRRLLDMRVDRIATPSAKLRIDQAVRDLNANVDYEAALDMLMDEMRARFATLGSPQAVVHRIVHGGQRFVRPTSINDEILDALHELDTLAPLHNPPALAAVRAARKILPDMPHIAVFDTAFHAALPDYARQYALPADLSKRLGMRRFGFHGINHAHVMRTVADYLKTQPQALRIISCHLGNGASVAAIEHGRSADTSMGMTPLEGLVMGTRAGDLDPGILLQLLNNGFDAKALDTLLNQESGLKGLTGTQDMEEIEERAAAGDERCAQALALFAYRVRKYIGAYAAAMGGVEVIAFTGGIGEHSAQMRERAVKGLEFLGVNLDANLNREAQFNEQGLAEISKRSSKVKVFVVRADEEMAAACEAWQVLAAAESKKHLTK